MRYERKEKAAMHTEENFNDEVTVVFAANDAYSPYLATVIESVIEHAAANRNYNLVVLHSSISLANQETIASLCQNFKNIRIQYIDLTEEIFNKDFYIGGKEGLTAETYYRLYIPQVLPHCKKVVYLDCDMVVLTDIAELYDTDLSGMLFASVPDYGSIGKYYMPENPQRLYWDTVLHLVNPEEYFCAGMLVINVEELQKIGSNAIVKLAQERDWQKHDQDVLNILGIGKTKCMPIEWDVLKVFDEIQYLPESLLSQVHQAETAPKIVHFSSRYKPWNTPFVERFELFWKYAVNTPYFPTMIQDLASYNPYRCYIIKNFSKHRCIDLLKTKNDMLLYQADYNLYLGNLGSNYTKIENFTLTKNSFSFWGRTMLMGLEDIPEVKVWLDINGVKYLCCNLDGDFSEKKQGITSFYGVGFSGKIALPTDVEEVQISIFCEVHNHMIRKTNLSFGKFAPIGRKCKKQYFYSDGYVCFYTKGKLIIKRCSKTEHLKYELRFLKELWTQCGVPGKKAAIARGLYFIMRKFQKGEIWLFSDRANKSGDNGEALFRFILKKKLSNVKPYFIIDKQSSDYKKLKNVGRVVNSMSWKHKWLFLNCRYNISSQADNNVIYPFQEYTEFYKDLSCISNFIFLQHGVIKEDMSATYNRTNQNMRIFVTAALAEFQSIINNPQYMCDKEIVKLTGLPRHDRLYHDEQKMITIMPTWRKYLFRHKPGFVGVWEPTEQFTNSDYFKFYNSLLNDKKLLHAAKIHGYKICFMPHPNVQGAIHKFDKNSDVEFFDIKTQYNKIFAESSLVITDRSSAIMDFAYLRKPVVYCLFDDDTFMAGAHVYVKGYFDYERDGFGEVEYDLESTVDRIIEYMENDCKLKDKYRERIDKFFAFNDQNNCQRVYEEIIKLDKRD